MRPSAALVDAVPVVHYDRVPEPLDDALAGLRALLLDLDGLVRAVAAGRRRGAEPPSWQRVELRPVDLKTGAHLQVVTHDGLRPSTRNHAPDAAPAAVDALLAEPFGNWHVQTRDRTVQLRVTKRGAAQVHSATTGDGGAAAPRPDAARRGHDRAKEHLLDPGDPLFDALGAGADKRRQVDAFLRQLQVVLPTAPTGRPLHVVDLGCGNAYLTFAAHRYLTDTLRHPVRTVGVDVRADVVTRNRVLAQRLCLDGLEFATGSIDEADPLPGAEVDLVLALHACDTATDDALARAVRWRAGAVLAAPCCHHDIHRQLLARGRAGVRAPAPYAPVVSSPILLQRFADVLTDALRAELMRLVGYRVDVVEFVDSRHTPRNALLRMQRRPRAPDADRGEALVDLATSWRIRPHLLDALGDEVETAVRQRIGPRP